MPAAALKSMADKSGKSLKTLERYWKQAEKQAEKQSPDDKYAYIMGIVKKRAGISEAFEFKCDMLNENIVSAGAKAIAPAIKKLGKKAAPLLKKAGEKALEKGIEKVGEKVKEKMDSPDEQTAEPDMELKSEQVSRFTDCSFIRNLDDKLQDTADA